MSGADRLFDHYSAGYEEALAQAISASGEGREYFAEGRLLWLRRCLQENGEQPDTALDFGCGDGATTPLFLNLLQVKSAVGVDVSEKSLEIARKSRGAPGLRFEPLRSFRPSGRIDLAYCNGVFHHIPPEERRPALALVRDSLRAGGLFSLWENNPWNPATRYVISRCAFDCDAQTITPPEARSLLCENGFEVLRTDFRFIFPRALRAFRKLEDVFYGLPFGAQYQVLSRKTP